MLAIGGIKWPATESVVDFKTERAAPVVPRAAFLRKFLLLKLLIISLLSTNVAISQLVIVCFSANVSFFCFIHSVSYMFFHAFMYKGVQ